MSVAERKGVVVTGIGMVTALGNDAAQVAAEIRAGASAAASPTGFGAGAFDCPVCAEIKGFDAQRYVSEPKMVRLMNRDAQLAVGAARLALESAGVKPGITYAAEEIGLFGATGLAGLPLGEVAPLLRASAGPNGVFDVARFGQAGLKAVSPLLSFKILSNMPLCFVSINENIQGPNAVFTPWEGEGAQALEAGMRALQAGDARCVLVGGCDVKTHELAFASLQERGLFSSWRKTGRGAVPAEGAVFLVLETEADAIARQAHVHGCLRALSLRPHRNGEELFKTRLEVLSSLRVGEADVVVSCANAEVGQSEQEAALLEAAELTARSRIYPKRHAGDLFAAAALLQTAVAAALTDTGAKRVLANCFGHGRTQAAFVLKAA